MRWISALLFGAIVAFVLPMALGGQEGPWMHSWTQWGTIRPFEHSPGFLFSLPLFVGASIALRLFFNWHRSG